MGKAIKDLKSIGRETFIIGPVRVTFVHLFEPRAAQAGQEPKYSVTALFPKGEVPKDLKRDIMRVAKEAFGPDAKDLKNPIRDGDADRQGYDGFEGVEFVNISSYNKPGLVDENVNPVMNREKFYNGCYCMISCSPYPYENSGNAGVGVGLNNVQFIRDGQKLGGGTRDPKEEFEPVGGSHNDGASGDAEDDGELDAMFG